MLASISTQFNCSEEELWAQIIRPQALQFVARPLLTFRPVNGQALGPKWIVGKNYKLKLYLLNVVPLGEHTIRLVTIDRDSNLISSEEAGQLAQVWNHRITFHGQISRREVETIYQQADVFVFPSFREPSGSVIFEAMRNGLPVITTDVGGPAHVVDASCGIRVSARAPEQLAQDLAAAIATLTSDPTKRRALSDGSLRRMADIGLWENKLDWLLDLYEQITPREREGTHSLQRHEVIRHVQGQAT